MVTAYQGGQVDAIIQFDVLSGKALLDDPNFNLHRARRPRCIARSGCAPTRAPFADKRVRQALALTFDRPALIQQLFQGKAELGNDHRIWQGYPYFDSSVPQRAQDIDKAKALLAEAGASNLTATLHAGQLLEIPDLATLLKSQAAQAGITLNVGGREPRHVLRRAVVPGRSRPTRRAPARPSSASSTTATAATPDVYLNAALKSKGIWNSSQYGSTGVRRGVHGLPEGRRRRCPEGGLQQDRDHPPRRHRRSACRTSTTTSPATRRSSRASTRAPSGRCSSRPRQEGLTLDHEGPMADPIGPPSRLPSSGLR